MGQEEPNYRGENPVSQTFSESLEGVKIYLSR